MNIKQAFLRGLAISGASMIISNANGNKKAIESALDIVNER